MESDDMNVQKQRKIIMMVNGEKKEIVYNDKDKGSESKSSSSKRKSSDRSASPTKRKKSSESSSSSSKQTDELSTTLNNTPIETSSSSSSKHKSSEKSTSSDKKNSSSHKSSSSTRNKSSSSTSKSKEHKSVEKLPSDDKSVLELELKKSEKHKSSKKSDSNFKSSEKSSSVNKSEQKASESSSQKHKSSDKSKEHPSDQGSASEIKQKSSSSTFKSKSSSEHKSSEKSSSDDKFALVSEVEESEKHKSSKKSDSKFKSSSDNKSEVKALESYSKKYKSSDKSKENPSDQSSDSEIKQKSSSKYKSSEKSSSSSKRSKSSEKSLSSSQSKRRKSSDEINIPNDLVTKEIQNLREGNEKFLSKLVEKFKDETKKVIEGLCKGTVIRDHPSFKFSHIVPLDLDDETKRKLAIINAQPIENYPDEDYEYILDINGLWVPKCRFEYFTDPKDNVLKYRKIADISQIAERPLEGQKGKHYEAGCCSTSKINENAAPEEKVEKEAILVPNTEIPLHEIIGLTDFQQIMTNEEIKVVSVKSEIIEDEILTKPINLFVPSTPNVDKQCPPDSKLNIRFENIKSEPQPHCSKDIPLRNIKQELNIDSKEYFKIIPQKSTNSEISSIENSEIWANMSEINRWIATKNKNYGFKDKEALNSMMTKNSLFSLFKCMDINCCYTTISCENFLEHLNIHKKSNSSIKDCFLNCAYCLDKSKDPIDLIEHYKNVHHNCIYQCSLCFYRAAEQQSVYDHEAHNHSSDTRKREILECPIVFPANEKIEEEKSRKKVEDIKECMNCEFCPQKFIIPEDYIKHLKSSHQIEEEKDKSDELINKMNINLVNNRIGKYQCLECENPKTFGSNSKIEMRTHLHQHPIKFHYVCVREINQYKLMKIKSRGDLQVTKYSGDLEVLKNTEGILKITTK